MRLNKRTHKDISKTTIDYIQMISKWLSKGTVKHHWDLKNVPYIRMFHLSNFITRQLFPTVKVKCYTGLQMLQDSVSKKSSKDYYSCYKVYFQETGPLTAAVLSGQSHRWHWLIGYCVYHSLHVKITFVCSTRRLYEHRHVFYILDVYE